ncbi:MAG: Arginase/agmatinase/formiminoglutamase [Crocinitomicaceae bacterium]|jgi:formiminoglutamase|nr:Arginase/agmatinase/formiminoglutamase [Crocinitomicaceae bacterium]
MESSKNGNFSFVRFSRGDLLAKTAVRDGETKIGQEISCEATAESAFVVLGICEDIGPQANKGNAGANAAFESFLPKFLSVQSNSFLSGKNLVLPGYIVQNKPFAELNVREVITELDDFVVAILEPFVGKSLTPVIIGGGHNNAYPILKSFSEKLRRKITAVNCDAHADFRACDFRHSGNPFSFAHRDGYLGKYAMLGLHESYNNQYIIDEIEKHYFYCTWYDQLLDGEQNFDSAFEDVRIYIQDDPFGVELDMDSIAYMPSSALSPSGITLLEARRYVSFFAGLKNALYLHLPEAAPATDSEKTLVGKALAYLVCDFIKGRQKV